MLFIFTTQRQQFMRPWQPGLAGVPSIVSTRHSLVARPRRLIVELKYAFAVCFCDWIVGICDATVANLKSIHSVPASKIVRVYNGAEPLLRVPRKTVAAEGGIHIDLRWQA
jgi:hypothetical protein